MKKAMLLPALLVLSATAVMAGEMSQGWTPPKISPELERIKALAGKWQGSSQEKAGSTKPVTVVYKVTSGGTAVIEKIDPNTPHEMTSVYHDKAGKLSLEHYCMLGNEPELTLKDSDKEKIELDMTPESHASLKDQMHMHSLALVWTPDGQLIETWTASNPDGKPVEPTVFKLKKIEK